MSVKSIWRHKNILAESPIWDDRKQLFYWVDIVSAKIHCLNIATDAHQEWQMPDKVGCIALCESGDLIAALWGELVSLDLTTAKITPLTKPKELNEKTQLNDGECDRQGRFWFGSSDRNEEKPLGAIYRMDTNHETHLIEKGFTVSNGFGWSPDNKTMYFTDSPTRTIYQYDFDATTGNVTNKRKFITLSSEEGFPDGLTVDSEGYIWSAHWGGFRVTRYTPDGKVDKVIPIPVPHVTSCCFGGKDLTTLFITTACRDLSPNELQQYPQAGNVFAYEANVTGIKTPLFKTD